MLKLEVVVCLGLEYLVSWLVRGLEGCFLLPILPDASAVSQNLIVRSMAIQYVISPVAVNLLESLRYNEVSCGFQIFFNFSAHMFK